MKSLLDWESEYLHVITGLPIVHCMSFGLNSLNWVSSMRNGRFFNFLKIRWNYHFLNYFQLANV